MKPLEDFLDKHVGLAILKPYPNVKNAMIEFAKMHVEEALKQASEKVTMKLRDNVHELDMNDDWMEVDKNSILTAYSLDNVEQAE